MLAGTVAGWPGHEKAKINPSSTAPKSNLKRTGPGRPCANPLDYDHPFASMAEVAKLLNLRYDSNRTRHSYYRDMRLVHEHFGCDPALITDESVS